MALVIWKDTHFALMEGLRQGGMRGVIQATVLILSSV